MIEPHVEIQPAAGGSWVVACSRHGIVSMPIRGFLSPIRYVNAFAAAWGAMGHAASHHRRRQPAAAPETPGSAP